MSIIFRSEQCTRDLIKNLRDKIAHYKVRNNYSNPIITNGK